MQFSANLFYHSWLNLLGFLFCCLFKIFLFLFWYITLKPASQFNAVCVAVLSNYMLHVWFIKLQSLEVGKIGWDTKLMAQVLQSSCFQLCLVTHCGFHEVKDHFSRPPWKVFYGFSPFARGFLSLWPQGVNPTVFTSFFLSPLGYLQPHRR